MARPIKKSCDYFSHDSDMRNHRKIRALRKKCANGYAIWNMLLEYLTSSEGNRFSHTEIEVELLSGDFEYPPEEIDEVIQYSIKLDLLQKSDSYIYSESLNERLQPVYDKRSRQRTNSNNQHRENGKFVKSNTEQTELSLPETPQSKVKESKVNKRDTIPKEKECCCYTDFSELKTAAAAAAKSYDKNLPDEIIEEISQDVADKHTGKQIENFQNLIRAFVKNHIPRNSTPPKKPIDIKIGDTIHKPKMNGSGFVYPTITGTEFDKKFTKVKLLDGSWQELSTMQSNAARNGNLNPKTIYKGKK
jgi:hypothetical protein